MKDDTGSPGSNPGSRQSHVGARVPLLRLDGAGWDDTALETWREALSSMVGTEVAHDLLALWLYPPDHYPDHQAVLLGPAALAADALELPRPTPRVDERELRTVEQTVRQAGYGSAICVAIPHGDRDVGLLLVANLRHGEYGSLESLFMEQAAEELGPILARLSRQWMETVGDGPAEYRQRSRASGISTRELNGLMDTLGAAMRDALTPRQLTQLIGSAIEHVLPHDAIELLIPDEAAEQHYRLSGHVHGLLWSHPSLVVTQSDFEPGRLFDATDQLLVTDVQVDRRAPIGGFRQDPSEEFRIRSVIGALLRGSGGGILGYLLLGNSGPDFYWEEDVDLLGRIAAVVSPRVEGLMLAWELDVLQSHLGILRSAPAHLGRIAEILATTAHLSAATRLVAQEAAAVLPFTQCEFALRLGADEEVIVFEPGETRPLSQLPVMRYTGTEMGRVLDGELSHAFAEARRSHAAGGEAGLRPSAAVVVPLRVRGRVFGTMTLLATGTQSFTRADVSLAQQLADVLAPHLELLRQGRAPARSSSQAWRRVTQSEGNRPA